METIKANSFANSEIFKKLDRMEGLILTSPSTSTIFINVLSFVVAASGIWSEPMVIHFAELNLQLSPKKKIK